MNILVIGAGMYVTGRNGTGTGTILSALVQLYKLGNVDSITVASPSASSEEDVTAAALRINGLLNANVSVHFELLGKDIRSSIEKIKQTRNIEGVVIAIPDHLHFEIGKYCLLAGMHTLMVKPLTPTVAEAKELIAIASENNLFACVEFHKRYDQTNLWIKKALQEERIGAINYIDVDYSQRISIPLTTFKSWSNQSNIFQYLGVHYVDLFYWLTRATPIRISANGVMGVLKSKGVDTYDSTHCTIEWQEPTGKNFFTIHNTNWVDPDTSSALSDQKYKIIGTKGRIECDQKNRGIELVSEGNHIQQINPYFSDYLPNADGDLIFSGYGFTSIAQFVDDLKSLKESNSRLAFLNNNRPSFKDSLTSVAVIEAANSSFKLAGAWQEVIV
ncbi:MAG: hypothetical protein RIQ89_625 [Bacteroidota bacterium]|jgi:D-galacturonate reductase